MHNIYGWRYPLSAPVSLLIPCLAGHSPMWHKYVIVFLGVEDRKFAPCHYLAMVHAHNQYNYLNREAEQ